MPVITLGSKHFEWLIFLTRSISFFVIGFVDVVDENATEEASLSVVPIESNNSLKSSKMCIDDIPSRLTVAS